MLELCHLLAYFSSAPKSPDWVSLKPSTRNWIWVAILGQCEAKNQELILAPPPMWMAGPGTCAIICWLPGCAFRRRQAWEAELWMYTGTSAREAGAPRKDQPLGQCSCLLSPSRWFDSQPNSMSFFPLGPWLFLQSFQRIQSNLYVTITSFFAFISLQLMPTLIKLCNYQDSSTGYRLKLKWHWPSEERHFIYDKKVRLSGPVVITGSASVKLATPVVYCR